MTNPRFRRAVVATIVGLVVAWGFDLASTTLGPASRMALFFGRFHPLLVHLPIGMLVLVAVLELSTIVSKGRVDAAPVLPVVLPITFLSAVVAFVAGTQLSRDGGYSKELLTLHRSFTLAAVTVVGAMVLSWLFVERGAPRSIYRLTLACALGLLSIGAHFGGSMTHGEDYLTSAFASEDPKPDVSDVPEPVAPSPDASTGAELAPSSVDAPRVDASSVDASSPDAPLVQVSSSQPVASPTTTPPPDDRRAYADVIAPLFAKKCVRCHGPKKHGGGLRVDSIAALRTGGDSGAGIVPSDTSRGEVLRRLRLPLEDDEHMPPASAPQFTAKELQLLEGWIAHGATTDLPASKLSSTSSRH